MNNQLHKCKSRTAHDRLIDDAGGVDMTTTNRLLTLIESHPGLTQLQLAQRLFGASADSRQLIGEIKVLIQLRLIDRFGAGGRGDPFT